MVGAVEQVRVDLQGDARVGVTELARDVDDVQPVRDQQRGEAVAERVERQLSRRLQLCTLDRLPEGFADVAVVEAAPERVAENEVTRRLERAREPAFTQALGERWGEDDLASAGLGLERGVFALAGELAVDGGSVRPGGQCRPR
jgi:hypothetical protein